MAVRSPGEVESAVHTPNELAAIRPVRIHARGSCTRRAVVRAADVFRSQIEARCAEPQQLRRCARSVHTSPLPAREHGLRAVSRATSLSAIPQSAIADSGIADNEIAGHVAEPKGMGKLDVRCAEPQQLRRCARSVHTSPLPAREHGLRAVSRATSLSAIPQSAIADSGIADNEIAGHVAEPKGMGKLDVRCAEPQQLRRCARSAHTSPLLAPEHGLRAVLRATSLSAIPQTAIADSSIADNDIAHYAAAPKSMGNSC